MSSVYCESRSQMLLRYHPAHRRRRRFKVVVAGASATPGLAYIRMWTMLEKVRDGRLQDHSIFLKVGHRRHRSPSGSCFRRMSSSPPPLTFSTWPWRTLTISSLWRSTEMSGAFGDDDPDCGSVPLVDLMDRDLGEHTGRATPSILLGAK